MIDFMTKVVITFVMIGWGIATLAVVFLAFEPKNRLPEKYLCFGLMAVKLTCIFNLSLFVVTLGSLLEFAEGCLQ